MKNIIDHNKHAEICDFFTSRGLTIKTYFSKNRHMTVTGKVRRVEFYPTTGTVNCIAANGLKPCTFRDMELNKALERVVTLANIGY